jgi:predicted  nucleic acid-binding Zn-ribbon protein
MNNHLALLKVEQALRSENMKMEYRKANKPSEVNILDYTVIAALERQIPQKANKCFDNSIQHEEPNDTVYLECPICKTCVGQLDDEDADGILKYNVYEKYCSNCGQAIKQMYIKEDYVRWGIETK